MEVQQQALGCHVEARVAEKQVVQHCRDDAGHTRCDQFGGVCADEHDLKPTILVGSRHKSGVLTMMHTPGGDTHTHKYGDKVASPGRIVFV